MLKICLLSVFRRRQKYDLVKGSGFQSDRQNVQKLELKKHFEIYMNRELIAKTVLYLGVHTLRGFVGIKLNQLISIILVVALDEM